MYLLIMISAIVALLGGSPEVAVSAVNVERDFSEHAFLGNPLLVPVMHEVYLEGRVRLSPEITLLPYDAGEGHRAVYLALESQAVYFGVKHACHDAFYWTPFEGLLKAKRDKRRNQNRFNRCADYIAVYYENMDRRALSAWHVLAKYQTLKYVMELESLGIDCAHWLWSETDTVETCKHYEPRLTTPEEGEKSYRPGAPDVSGRAILGNPMLVPVLHELYLRGMEKIPRLLENPIPSHKVQEALRVLLKTQGEVLRPVRAVCDDALGAASFRDLRNRCQVGVRVTYDVIRSVSPTTPEDYLQSYVRYLKERQVQCGHWIWTETGTAELCRQYAR